MKEDLLKIINNYGVMNQLEYYQTEVWELNDAISNYHYEEYKYYPSVEDILIAHIKEELADNYVMLYQFPQYYYERLECHNIAPYEFKTDNYEHIEEDGILEYLKKFQKDVCKLTCAIAVAEEREQDYISEYRYNDVISAIDTIIYKLKSIQEYYKIKDKEIERVMKYKVDRQIERIKNEV